MTKSGDLEISLGACDILENLGLQGFSGGPLHFATQAGEELEIERCFLGEIDRLEVEDVGFYTESDTFEGGPVADVRHGLEASVADCQPRDVDTESGQEPFIGCEVSRVLSCSRQTVTFLAAA